MTKKAPKRLGNVKLAPYDGPEFKGSGMPPPDPGLQREANANLRRWVDFVARLPAKVRRYIYGG